MKTRFGGESGYSDVNMHEAYFQLVSNKYSTSNYLLPNADEYKASLPVCNTNAIVKIDVRIINNTQDKESFR